MHKGHRVGGLGRFRPAYCIGRGLWDIGIPGRKVSLCKIIIATDFWIKEELWTLCPGCGWNYGWIPLTLNRDGPTYLAHKLCMAWSDVWIIWLGLSCICIYKYQCVGRASIRFMASDPPALAPFPHFAFHSPFSIFRFPSAALPFGLYGSAIIIAHSRGGQSNDSSCTDRH